MRRSTVCATISARARTTSSERRTSSTSFRGRLRSSTQGVEEIAQHDRGLVERLIAALDGSGYRFVSPTAPAECAAIVVVDAGGSQRNERAYRRLAEAGIDVALRGGNIRLSPHLYNTAEELDRAAEVLAAAG